MDIVSMDATNAILTAVATGAVDGVTDAVKDGVRYLGSMIKERLEGDEDALADFNRYSRKPTPDLGEDVSSALVEHGVDKDEEIVAKAREVLEQAGPAATGAGSVAAGVINQTVNGGGSAYTGGVHTTHNTYVQPGSSPEAPAWRLSHHRGDTYLLENVGGGTAYDVSLDVPNSPRFDPPEYADPTWYSNDGRTFMAASSFGGGNELVVTYAKSKEGPVTTWRRALPPKP